MKMKISILSFYQGIVNRGVERYVAGLKKHLASDYEIKVYSAKKTFSPAKKTCPFLRRFYLDYNNRQIACFTLKTLKELWQKSPDVLIPTNNGWQSIFCKVFCLFTSRRLVLAGHSGLGQDDKLNLWLFPDVFVVFSEHQKNWAKGTNPRVKIAKIPHGVDLKKFNPKVKPARLGLERPVTLCVSGPERFKRVDSTVKAVAKLQKGSLLLIGKQSQEIINLGKKLLGTRFKQITASFEKMPSFYRASEVFTLVSESREAFGISYLEAMACNLPVVVTDDSLRREIVGNAGLFIKNPENVESYARILKTALERNWQDRPRRQAEKFSWERTARLYEKLFDSLT